MIKKTLLAIAFVATTGMNGFAQLGTPLSQYSGNQMVYNPAYAGIYEMLTFNLSARTSWVGIKDAPSIINFNGHSPFQKERHAWGWVYQRESWGPLTGNLIYGNYSFKVYLEHGILSLGLQAGVLNHVVNWDKITEIEHEDDPGYMPYWGKTRTSSTRFDANVGAFYLTPKYYIGISALHFTNPRFDQMSIKNQKTLEEEEWYSEMRAQFVLIGGYHFDINSTWAVRPEAFLRYVPSTPLSVNIGAHAYYDNNYSLGMSFMSGQKAISFIAKAMITDEFRIGYSYDVYWGPIKKYQRGSHEIMINYYLRGIWWEKETTERLLWH